MMESGANSDTLFGTWTIGCGNALSGGVETIFDVMYHLSPSHEAG
jgi:hypothetical protein